MGILLKENIKKALKKGTITSYGKKIEEKLHVGVNSIDVTIGNKLKTYFPVEIITMTSGEKIVKKIASEHTFIDMKKENKSYEIEIPEEGLIITPDMLFLGYTNEGIGSSRYIPMYEGRSSMARLGIQSHISAGFGDIGFDAQWTLEITVTQPTKIYPNERIGQVFFMKVSKKDYKKAVKKGYLYKGKYGKQVGVQPSMSFKDK